MDMRNGRRTTRRSSAQGFSLIELMVVITIIGLLGGIVGVNVMRYLAKANVQTTKSNMISLESRIKEYYMEKRRIPDTLEELAGEDGFLDSDEVPTDAWGNEFIYEPQGKREFQLYSLGADGVEGGDGEDADIALKAARKQGGSEDE